MLPAYLVYSTDSGEWVLEDRLAKATPHLKRRPGAAMVLLHEFYLTFKQHVGDDTNQVFGRNSVAPMMGLDRRNLSNWISEGIVTPTIAGGRGQGDKNLWSFRDAFLCAVVGCLHRAGARKEHLKEFFHAIRDGEKRSPKRERAARHEAAAAAATTN